LRQLRPAAISVPAASATAARNAQSIAAAATQPISAEKKTASRPANQTRTRANSGNPCTGSRPVQFGIAVRRKPVTTAAR
jgi:hypothetical protein